MVSRESCGMTRANLQVLLNWSDLQSVGINSIEIRLCRQCNFMKHPVDTGAI